MYHLNRFCNIIFELRKERGWTQTVLAEKLEIAPQSISKWECGIGYPDVTLFPLIAELFEVDMDVLFGKDEDKIETMNLINEKKHVFEPLREVKFSVGNECDIIVVRKDGENAYLNVSGDPSFMEFFALEQENGVLYVDVKNPTGSDTAWIPYDRGNYQKRNAITLHTGKEYCNLSLTNYLDLNACASDIDNNTDRWIIRRERASDR